MDRELVNLQVSLARSPKRSQKERVSVHRWHPYYAGYSQRFVEDTIRAFALPEGAVVLDPWNGSGTTTLTSQQLGLTSIGIELNPVMVVFALAKSLAHLQSETQVLERVELCVNRARVALQHGTPNSGPLDGWVPKDPLSAVMALRDSIVRDQPATLGRPSVLLSRTSEVTPRPFYGETTAFLLAGLFQVLRMVGSFGSGSNPTWVVKKPDITSVSSPESVFQLFSKVSRQMLRDLRDVRAGADSAPPDVFVFEGDSRSLPIADASVDAIITSPPYCTRIDYAVSTKPELLLLGFEEGDGFDAVRRNTMGAPVIVNKGLSPQPQWGAKCLAMLASVKDHPAKASETYYYPNLLQYFRDAELSVQELLRVLKPGKFAAVVVQSSYYKEIEIPLGDIYVELAESLGGFASVARREVIRQHMAHVNTTSEEYRPNKVFFEDVVLIQR